MDLMQAHYDPAYDRSRLKRMKQSVATLQTERLDAGALDDLADRILSLTDAP